MTPQAGDDESGLARGMTYSGWCRDEESGLVRGMTNSGWCGELVGPVNVFGLGGPLG